MSHAEAFERLRARDEGRAIPNGNTLPWPRASAADRLVLLFVRMGGESSSWGVGLGHPDAEPEFFTCAEPRNADLHAAFVLGASDAILRHVEHPSLLSEEERNELLLKDSVLTDRVKSRQLWVPGPTHLAMLQFLDFRCTFANTGTLKAIHQLHPSVGRVSNAG